MNIIRMIIYNEWRGFFAQRPQGHLQTIPKVHTHRKLRCHRLSSRPEVRRVARTVTGSGKVRFPSGRRAAMPMLSIANLQGVFHVLRRPLPLLCDLSALSHCGESTPLYFTFVKQVILLLLFNCVLVSLPAVLVNFAMGT